MQATRGPDPGWRLHRGAMLAAPHEAGILKRNEWGRYGMSFGKHSRRDEKCWRQSPAGEAPQGSARVQERRWQATEWPGSVAFSAGTSLKHSGNCAIGQRVWKWQPVGG